MKRLSLLFITFLLIILHGFAATPNFKKLHNINRLSTGLKVEIVKEMKQIREDVFISPNYKTTCTATCAVSVIDENGTQIIVIASAGWFLMGCENASERACEKANAIAQTFLNNN